MAILSNINNLLRISNSTGRVLINSTAAIVSNSEVLTVGGRSSLKNDSTSAAALVIVNGDSTANTFQPYMYFSDVGGNRAGFGVETSTASLKINAQANMIFSTGAASLGGTERMRITSGGKVIVGTDSSNALEVFSSGDTEIGFSYASHGNVYAKIIGDITQASPLGGEMAFQTATGGTLSERMRITAGGDIWQLNGAAEAGTYAPWSGSNPDAGIAINVPGNSVRQFSFVDSSTPKFGGGMRYFESTNFTEIYSVLDGTATTHLRADRASPYTTWLNPDSIGNVGIGITSAPEAKLTVTGGVGAGTHTHAVFTGTAGRGLALKSGQTGGQHNGKAIIDAQDTEASGASMDFQIGGSTKLAIDTSGNVGIGTTSPGRGLTIDKSNANAALEIIKNNTTNQIVYLGTGSSAGTDDPILQMKHNGTENIRLYSTGSSWLLGGNVGIGTNSPQNILHLKSDDPKVYYEDGNAGTNEKVYVVYPAGSQYVLQTQTDAFGAGQQVYVVDRTGTTVDKQEWYINNSPALSLDSVGDSTFGGNIFIASTGDGIFLGGTSTSSVLKKFVGNQAGNGAQWTPTVTTSQGTSPTITSSSGYYQQVGNVVTVSFEFTMGSNHASGAGTVIISNLPIAIADTNHVSGCGSINDLGKTINVRHYTATNQIGMNFYDGNYCGTQFRTVGTVTYWAAT